MCSGLHTSSTEISSANLQFLRHNVFRHNGSSPHSKQTYPSYFFLFIYLRYLDCICCGSRACNRSARRHRPAQLRCSLPKRVSIDNSCGTVGRNFPELTLPAIELLAVPIKSDPP